jgi:hypothetical protein
MSPNLVEDCKQTKGSQQQFQRNRNRYIMVRTVPVEMVNEDDEESEVRSDATEAWESQ